MGTRYIPNEIRSILANSKNWCDGVAEDDPSQFIPAYNMAISTIVTEKKKDIADFRRRHSILTILTYASAIIGGTCAIAASALYALNKSKNGNMFNEYATLSLALSVMTGIFVFLLGCAQLVADYTKYDKRALMLRDEVRLLQLTKTFVNAKTNPLDSLDYAKETDYFSKLEHQVFGDTTSAVQDG